MIFHPLNITHTTISAWIMILLRSLCYTFHRPLTRGIGATNRSYHQFHHLASLKPISSSSSSSFMGETTITISSGGEPIEVSAAPGLSTIDLRNAVDSGLFQLWLKNMQSEESGLLGRGKMSLKNVLIQGVDMFGRGVGFLKFRADVLDKETGQKVPGIVFSRGQSVAVLIILESRGERYAVLTEQARVPVGRNILELPAGMLDEKECDIIGTAVREVEEETGISLNLADMVNLTSLLEPSTGHKMFPSPGGCDEEISLFLYRGTVKSQVIDELQGKEMGLREHGELIKVHVVPYDKLWKMTADAKVLSAVTLYEMGRKEGLI